MSLSGFERLGVDDEPGATWIIPSSLSARELHENHDCIERHRRDPVMQYGEEDPVNAEDLIRRKPTARRRADFDDDSDGGDLIDDGDEGFLFPAGGPVDKVRKKDALAELKKKRRKRRATADSDDEVSGLDDATREARRKARLENDLEKRRKIKSTEFVGDSDDDSEADAEFLRKEEERRKGHASKVIKALIAGRIDTGETAGMKKSKRKSEGMDAMEGAKRKKTGKRATSDDELDDSSMDNSSPLVENALEISSEEGSETPLSSPHIGSSQSKAGDLLDGRRGSSHDAIGGRVQAFNLDEVSNLSADDDEDLISLRAQKPRRAVLLDESDED